MADMPEKQTKQYIYIEREREKERQRVKKNKVIQK